MLFRSDYKTIQRIEQKFHEVAVDGAMNYPIIKDALTKDGVGDLIYKPKHEFKELPLADLNLSTFTVYHTKTELKYISYVIKRLFLEHSQVWTYDELWNAVQTNTFTIPVNPQIFQEENFVIALNQLTWDPSSNVYVTDVKANRRKFLDRLFDQFDRRIEIGRAHV